MERSSSRQIDQPVDPIERALAERERERKRRGLAHVAEARRRLREGRDASGELPFHEPRSA